MRRSEAGSQKTQVELGVAPHRACARLASHAMTPEGQSLLGLLESTALEVPLFFAAAEVAVDIAVAASGPQKN